MSKFVVTGPSGYVARRLICRLLSNGHEVVGLTRVASSVSTDSRYREVAVGDYTDEALLAGAVDGAETVFHLAARAHQRSKRGDNTALFHAANVAPTEVLARACSSADVGRLLMVSSIGVLGDCSDITPFSDYSVPAPVEPYAVSKAKAEQRVADLLSNSRCDYCILRPPLVYGPGSPGNFASLVAIAAKAPLIPLAGIRALRTFIYIDHLLDALLIAANHPAASNRIFVVADKTDTSVEEIVRIAARVFGRESWRIVAIPEILLRAISILTGRYAKFNKLVAPLRVDCSGFQDATGWRPTLSTSEAIVATLQDWPDTLTLIDAPRLR